MAITKDDILYYFHAELGHEPVVQPATTTFERPSGAAGFVGPGGILTPVIRDTLRQERVLANDGEYHTVLTLEPNAIMNLITDSRQFTDFTATRALLSNNVGLSSRGNKDMTMLVEDSTASATHILQKTFTAADNSRYTVAITCGRAPVGDARNVRIQFRTKDETLKIVDVNLDTGAKIATSGLTSSDKYWVRAEGDHWRITLSVVMDTGAGQPEVFVYIYNASTGYTGDGASGILVDDGVLYEGTPAYPATAIDTTTATAIREAELCKLGGLPTIQAHAGYFSFVSLTEGNAADSGALRVVVLGSGDNVADTVRIYTATGSFDRRLTREFRDSANSLVTVSTGTLVDWAPGAFVEVAYTLEADGSGRIDVRADGGGAVSGTTASTNLGPEGQEYATDDLQLTPNSIPIPTMPQSFKMVKLASVSGLTGADLLDTMKALRRRPSGLFFLPE